jgi:hypothetical protein
MEKRKFLTLPGLELPPLRRPARSQSLYRLRYPGSLSVRVVQFHEISHWLFSLTNKLNSVALVRKQTIPTERPQPVGEVSANFS